MTADILEETKSSVKRLQEFDADQLPRKDDLGSSFELSEAVNPAKGLIRLFQQLSLEALDDLPQSQLDQIKKQADADYNRLHQALEFDPSGADSENPTQKRDTIINNIVSAYDTAFSKLHPFISYSLSKVADFKRLETDARATLQAVEDEAKTVTEQLSEHEASAQQILEDVRQVAAEQGVSQQAIYFKEEAESHGDLAETWRWRTIYFAVGLGLYAGLSIFLHKWELLAPDAIGDAIQLAVSKVLIFFVIAYMLFLSAKNFLNHKHNEIVNKHRQNALMTFQALSDAATEASMKDVVLNHAAECIFKPQETGYIKAQGGASDERRAVVEYLPRSIARGEEAS